MFEALPVQPADPLLAVMALYTADPRSEKIDLGVGVYRDDHGVTPVFRAVKEAERHLLETQASKSYLGMEGDHSYYERLWTVVSGQPAMPDTVAAVQTPGGTGALRLAAELARRSGAGRIWLGLPGWSNHAVVFKAAGLEVATYPFFDTATQSVLLDRTMAALEQAEPGDLALFHASCHNPTGVSLTAAEWAAVTEGLAKRGIVPLIDLAYQGFGRGLDEDAAGLRHVLSRIPETLVAVSSSKSFGIYRDRTGAVYATTAGGAAGEAARTNLAGLARATYSMPPDHGAAVVSRILGDAALTADWKAELDGMRRRLTTIRQAFAAGLERIDPVLGATARQEGMFSLLPLTEGQVARLRSDHAVFMPASGRVNIAGLRLDQVPQVVSAIAAVAEAP